MSPSARSLRLLLSFIVLMSWPSLARAQAEDCAEDLVYPPNEMVEGRTAGEWSALFWDWALRLPKPDHPMLEPTGRFCELEQNDPIFFLSGAVIGSAPQDEPRTMCAVPCGKDIQVMIHSVIAWAPGDCDDAAKLDTECRQIVHGIVEGIEEMQLIVDGRSIGCLKDHQEVSPLFESTMPEANLFDIPPPLTRTFVAEGFYPILRAEKLAPGPHTIAWVARQRGENFPLLTYELMIGPCNGAVFRRGDSDGNGAVNVTDAVAALSFLFAGADPLRCLDAADSNDDGGLNVTDAVHTLLWLFQGGTVPPAPGPADCGVDPTGDELDCTKGC